MSISRESLVGFLESELALDVTEIEDDTELVSSGIIDSFSLVTLISFLEKQGSFRISPMDVNLENLDTINRILAFAEQSTSKGK